MRLKLDENLPADALAVLRVRGVDVHTVGDEGLVGAVDPVVLDAARTEGRMLITLDRGFGDVRQHPPGTHPGIVVLRPVDQRPVTIVATLERSRPDLNPSRVVQEALDAWVRARATDPFSLERPGEADAAFAAMRDRLAVKAREQFERGYQPGDRQRDGQWS